MLSSFKKRSVRIVKIEVCIILNDNFFYGISELIIISAAYFNREITIRKFTGIDYSFILFAYSTKLRIPYIKGKGKSGYDSGNKEKNGKFYQTFFSFFSVFEIDNIVGIVHIRHERIPFQKIISYNGIPKGDSTLWQVKDSVLAGFRAEP